MKKLIELAHGVMQSSDPADVMRAQQGFVEGLTFARFDEIVSMLDAILAEDYIGFPVWARNLAFRLACLLEPNNAQIRRRAAGDLHDFGPDWELEVGRLLREADKIEGKGTPQ
jgi:hypothetical protein